MAAAAGGACDVSVENAISERNLLLGKTLWHGEFARLLPGVGMDAFRRQSLCRGVACRHPLGRRRRRDCGFRVAALIADAPNSSVDVVRDKERAVWGDGQARRPERCTTGIFHGAGKAIGKDDIGTACFSIDKRLEHDVVAALRPRSSVPGTVKCDEGAALIGFGEGRAEVDLHVVGRPMRGKERDRFLPLGADTDLLAAVASVFWPEHQLSLYVVEIAFRAAVIRAL